MGPMVWEKMSFEEFHDGGHLGHQNKMILAILNLCVASHQVLAQSNIQFGRRCHLKNFKMAAILDIGKEQLW